MARRLWVQSCAGGALVTLQLPPALQQSLTASELAAQLEDVGPLCVPLGVSLQGRVVSLDFADPDTPHLGVYGVTGSGKSEMLRAIVWALVTRNEPSSLDLVLIDGKARELVAFDGVSHLAHPVVRASSSFGPVLSALRLEVDRRIAEPARCARRMVVVIDEVADVLRATGGVHGAGGDALHRLASMGRGLGVHVIVATHHPTSEMIGRLVSASVRVRLCGAVADDAASRLVMGVDGYAGSFARRLEGRGDFVLVHGEEVTRLHGAMVTDDEMAMLPRGGVQRELVEVVEDERQVHVSQAPTPIGMAEVAVVLAEARSLNRMPGVKRVEQLVRTVDGQCGARRAERVRASAEQLVAELERRGLTVVSS